MKIIITQKEAIEAWCEINNISEKAYAVEIEKEPMVFSTSDPHGFGTSSIAV